MTDPSGMIAQPAQWRNPSNMISPSGEFGILSAIRFGLGSRHLATTLTAGLCKIDSNMSQSCNDRCESNPDFRACMVACGEFLLPDLRDALPNSQIARDILSSTVTLATIRTQPENGCLSLFDVLSDKVNGTSKCFSRNSSLGVVVSGGILTHDHYYPLTGDSANDGDQSMNFIKTFEWLYIGGSNNFFAFVPVSELEAEFPSNGNGTMLIKLPFSETRFGTRAATAPVDLLPSDPVYFAYFEGNNADLGHYPSQSRISVGVDLFQGFIDDFRFGLQGLSTSVGDSGGGHFNSRGELIGIYWGQVSHTGQVRQTSAKVM